MKPLSHLNFPMSADLTTGQVGRVEKAIMRWHCLSASVFLRSTP